MLQVVCFSDIVKKRQDFGALKTLAADHGAKIVASVTKTVSFFIVNERSNLSS